MFLRCFLCFGGLWPGVGWKWTCMDGLKNERHWIKINASNDERGDVMRYDKVTDPFYKTALWRRARRMALERDMYMCVECMAAYRRGELPAPRAATTVHHILPRTERPELELELDNLQSLCDACHNKKHPEKGGGNSMKVQGSSKARVIKV